MAKKRAPRVLFFTANAMPTTEEYDLADQLGGNVGFRNGKIAGTNTKPEPCDAVAAVKGATIPLIYARAEIPRVKSAMDVARLQPKFARDIGYSDDDTAEAGFSDADTPEVPEQPSSDGEPNPNEPPRQGDNLVPGNNEPVSPATRRGRKPATPPEPPAPADTPPAPAPAAPDAAGGSSEPNPPAGAASPPWGNPPGASGQA